MKAYNRKHKPKHWTSPKWKETELIANCSKKWSEYLPLAENPVKWKKYEYMYLQIH